MRITRTTGNTDEVLVFNEAEASRHGMSVVDLDGLSPRTLLTIATALEDTESAASIARAWAGAAAGFLPITAASATRTARELEARS